MGESYHQVDGSLCGNVSNVEREIIFELHLYNKLSVFSSLTLLLTTLRPHTLPGTINNIIDLKEVTPEVYVEYDRISPIDNQRV